MPVRYIMEYMMANFPVTVVIYYHDGSVAVSHGGSEMGQGINTKVTTHPLLNLAKDYSTQYLEYVRSLKLWRIL